MPRIARTVATGYPHRITQRGQIKLKGKCQHVPRYYFEEKYLVWLFDPVGVAWVVGLFTPSCIASLFAGGYRYSTPAVFFENGFLEIVAEVSMPHFLSSYNWRVWHVRCCLKKFRGRLG